MRHKRYYDLALSMARLNKTRYRFGAVLVRNKRILSVAHNILKTHPKMKRYPAHCNSIHAELLAIIRAGDCTGATLYVARDSTETRSKPCQTCMKLIKEAKIRKICYNNGRNLEIMRVF